MSTAVTKTTAIDEIKATLGRQISELKDALPRYVDAGRFIRTVTTYLMQYPDLANPEKCDRASLYSSIIKCAHQGLYPDGVEAALIIRGGKSCFQAMYQGKLKQVRNSGELSSIGAHVVYTGDKARYWVDSEGEHIEHEIKMDGERGKRLWCYAIARTKDGAVYIEPMTEAQVMAIKKSGTGGNSQYSPWNGPFEDEMWKKSVLNRISKRLPKSTDLQTGAFLDDDDEPGEVVLPPTAPEAAPAKPASRLHAVIDEKAKTEPAPVSTPLDPPKAAAPATAQAPLI